MNDGEIGGIGHSRDRSARPRLAPRPLASPDIDPETRRAFGRPNGVSGAFLPRDGHARDVPEIEIQRPDPVLAEAFGRPAPDADVLQRPPDEDAMAAGQSAAEASDPWRNPQSSAQLGAPALRAPVADPQALPPAPRLTTREVLFGRRIERRALAVLAVAALVIGVAGGLIGRLTAEVYEARTSSRVSISQYEPDAANPGGPIASVAQAVTPAVVSIRVLSGNQAATGSGVVIDGAGYIVTNNHVVSMAARGGDTEIEVLFFDGRRAPAEIVGRDTRTDLAVIRTTADNLTVAEFGVSQSVQVGEEVLAIGAPLGLDRTVTRGIVSALNRPVPLSGEGTDTDGVIDAIQTDASINPGNSGGPLVDLEGRVIGINTAIRSATGGSIGLGFAIPADTVVMVSQQLISQGRAEHPGIGVTARSVSNDVATGAEIANVNSGSPAERAGIREGDVIVRVGDREVFTADELIVAVNNLAIGESVTVQLVRAGRLIDIEVTPEALP
ncbi:trypsin-like peptidase domain-containing protein [Hoyosella sp. YIM 151337]|uniref:S1C family serine protease n=1 Tax=Hoyosella sp. YIM 151337 TaxID=2992742 RepID=UPI002235D65C|nr:trypsin-like peptidase domain-containing protein [Hoyosella sp. YIM 151337]MCW4355124.1 trypsin-like peptidase domain-containing protein [Hoyosella sp. YIM 151337]